jgi:hypothetical protein
MTCCNRLSLPPKKENEKKEIKHKQNFPHPCTPMNPATALALALPTPLPRFLLTNACKLMVEKIVKLGQNHDLVVF